MPLGVLPFPELRGGVDAAIEPGATVVLYTDGLIERPGEHHRRRHRRGSPTPCDGDRDPTRRSSATTCCATLVPGGGAADDVALLALRNVPMTDRFARRVPSRARGALARCARCCAAGCATSRRGEQEIAEIVTACGEAATNAIEHAGAAATPFEISGRAGRPRVEIDRARPRRLAPAARGRSAGAGSRSCGR